MNAATVKEAKERAYNQYRDRAIYVRPYKYASRGNNFYEFVVFATVSQAYKALHATNFTENQTVKSLKTGDVLQVKKIKDTLLICIDPNEPKRNYPMGFFQPTYILSKKNAIIID
jgi:hypothetical protein